MAARVPGDDNVETTPFSVQLSPMRRKHVRSVMRIETESFAHPWTTSLFLSELAMRNKRAYTVALRGSLVIGYTGLMLIGEDAHVTNIAVDSLWRRHKVATRLMLHNVRIALKRGATNLTLEVRVSDRSAQALYGRFGFAPAGIRKNYYEGNEDALVMWAHDIDSEEFGMRMSALEAAVPGVTISEVPG